MTACPPWPRAMVTAAVITGIAVALHGLGGGSVAPVLALVVFVALVAAVRWAPGAAGANLRTATLLLGGQIGAHVLLTPMHLHSPAGPASPVHPGHGLVRQSLDPLGPQLIAWLHDSLTCLVAEPGMLAAHGVAAAVAGAWLAAGERRAVTAARIAAGSAAGWLRWLAAELVTVRPPAAEPVAFVPGGVPHRLATDRFAWAVVRRGPPLAPVR